MASEQTMEENRLSFHNKLEEISGNIKVYFQPPETLKIEYPCIIYSRENVENVHADDLVYNRGLRYTVTIVDADPDSILVDKLSKFKHARFVRHYATQGLNHDVFTVFHR